jgi:hypothetical protein
MIGKTLGQYKITGKLVSRLRSSLHISAALDDAGVVGPPRNISDIPSSARLAIVADIYNELLRRDTGLELRKGGMHS